LTYRILIREAASKALAKLPAKASAQVRAEIDALASNPRPHGCKKLVGRDLWRFRVRDWRVVYAIRDAELIVLVVRVAHRSEAYE
jgi:mRNA interferase RelE/StbE